ncbi:hypothetical protein K1T71_005876 [Dendrolimus kikuchii]|uniref:Uncharacterized protein n=1 Tax=Dendrolimus kikuchii TaxID=765133 RepID=A0ACC1D2E2_9NEOP|nr:hypothetical protein K1T71_005876 [Dendrolimus kikuchii]
MEPTDFDLNTLLKKHQKNYKSKPRNMTSMAGGVKKRLETNLQNRRNSRMTIFDKIRNMSGCESPVQKPDLKSKSEHRRLQLEKWKEEKERKKKEAAANKPKPFIAGVAHASKIFLPPPPVKSSKAVPSTSGVVGVVTRSQAAKNKTKQKTTEMSSFAPKNSTFKPPVLNIPNIPLLAPVNRNTRKEKINITFKPVLPSSKVEDKDATSKSDKTRVLKNKVDVKNVKSNTHSSRITRASKFSIQSSSSGDFVEISQCESSIAQSSLSSESEVEFQPVVKTAKTSRKSIAKKDLTPKSESSSEEKLRSPENTLNTPAKTNEEPKKISPCVTLSRGKENARREMKKKMEEGLLDEDESNVDSIDDFRRQLASEIERITELCVTWDKILEQTKLPETIQEYVLAAVGQGRLLMSQKMQQFASLVERCAKPEPGTALVTPADLQGFWDMVFMQVENVYIRFKKLEQLRDRGWVEEKPVERMRRPTVQPRLKKNKPNAGPSRLKEMIASARRAKKEQEVQSSMSSSPSVTSSDTESKSFEAGFFCVKSPVRSPARSTPTKPCLLKAVLSNEAKKASASKASASFAMLRASVMSKCVETDGIAPLPQTPLTPINLSATPGRGILKSANKQPSRKSIKVVLFDKSDDSDATANNEPPENGHNVLNFRTYNTSIINVSDEISEQEKRQDVDSVECIGDDVNVPNKRVSDCTNTDNGKENRRKSKEKKKQSKLIRQDAKDVETPSPVKTRNQRMSMRTPLLDIPIKDTSSEKKKLSTDQAPRRSTRSRRSMPRSSADRQTAHFPDGQERRVAATSAASPLDICRTMVLHVSYDATFEAAALLRSKDTNRSIYTTEVTGKASNNTVNPITTVVNTRISQIS